MASNRPAAKTPTVAIARVLRDLGLKQGQDFRVKGEYRRGERIGTYVVLYSKAAEERVSVQRDVIEQRTAAEGFPFNVSVYYSKTGYRGVHVANFGTRVRETGTVLSWRTENTATEAPTVETVDDVVATGPARSGMATNLPVQVETIDEVKFADDMPQPAEQRSGRWHVPAMPKLKLGDPRPAFDNPRDAAERAREAFPAGTRVKGWDSSGKPRTGTVNGAGWGKVENSTHPNYGRAWVDVNWDALPGDMGAGRRNRPFADDLTKI